MSIIFALILYFYLFLSWILPPFLRKKPKKNSVLYLAAFFPHNSGYHWRALKWKEKLEENGYDVTILNALNKKQFNAINDNSQFFHIRFLHYRFWQVLKARRYETVIVRREILIYNDYGNLFLEKLLRKLCDNRILDFDDDLAAAKKQPKTITSLYGKFLMENGNSFRESFHYYQKFIVASQYLKEYVLQYSSVDEKQIGIIPTCVDYDRYSAKDYTKSTETFTLGWIGGEHNYPLLLNVIPTLNQLAKHHQFRLLIIGGTPFQAEVDFEIVNSRWSLATEVEDLYKIDVGLMPLDNSTRSKGKGGFKLIQYMGMGIVSVAQNVTINADIVENGVNSFLYDTKEELYQILKSILEKEINLEEIGRKAKKRIENGFTFESIKDRYTRIIYL